MARFFAAVLLATAACSPSAARNLAPNGTPSIVDLRAAPGLLGARKLDEEGVRSFREGRYIDATLYFRAAFRMGGPSSELWNLARSRERLDDAEGAASDLTSYLDCPDLAPSDRAQADRELRMLRERPSRLTVTTMPPGAIVTLDGTRPVGPAPVSVDIAPGAHSIAVRRDGYELGSRPIEARFGRAIIVSLDLGRVAK